MSHYLCPNPLWILFLNEILLVLVVKHERLLSHSSIYSTERD